MEDLIVSIKQGKLHGSTITNYYDEKIYSFQGIPYAKPPLGNLRFKAPESPENWSGIWDATKEREGSYAINWVNNKVCGSEDCLYLNVYTKELPNGKSSPKPVMVYIHGGGFKLGPSSSDVYGPQFLLIEDVVVVVITYRLGLLAFLSLEDFSLEVPGNAGFKDMVMALRWVHDNIKQFNGDPSNVTIFGQSAGAAAVHLLMLSPMTKGLINRVIAQSGSALNTWASAKNFSKEIAALLNQNRVDEKAILSELMHKTVEQLFEIQEKLNDDLSPCAQRPFGYVVERNNQNAFLIEHPIDIITKGNFQKIPFMNGYTSIDGIIIQSSDGRIGPQELEKDLPHQLGYPMGNPKSQSLAMKLEKFYFENQQSMTDLQKTIIKDTDVIFFYFTYVTVKNQALFPDCPNYLYRISVDTTLNLYKTARNIKEKGASHLDELGYLFKNFTTPELKSNSLEEILMKRFVRLWTNFAKYGNPTPNKNDELLNNIEWKPVQGDTLNFVDIGETLVLGVNPEQERINFWKNIFSNSPKGKQYV